MKDHHVHATIRQFVKMQTTVNVDRYSDVGGIGALYFGRRFIIGDRVAMKFYPVDPAGLAHREPFLLQALRNENILPIHHAEVISNQFAYYVTPEVTGGDLQDFSERNILSADTALDIISGVLNGISAIHNQGMVHRDLKTLNILIDSSSRTPYIADFGFVKEIPTGSTSTTASSYTHLYRSKEMIERNEHYFESDIYQIGVIMFQILGGFFPFNDPVAWLDAKTLVQFNSLPTDQEKYDCWSSYIDKRICKHTLLDFTSLPPYIPDTLIKVLKKATHPNAVKRYHSCTELAVAVFNIRKRLKSWWIDGTSLVCEDRKKGKKFSICNFDTSPKLKISINGGQARVRAVGSTLQEIISYVNSD
jgi:eukaryotic-like serine/threonine-protein kinase